MSDHFIIVTDDEGVEGHPDWEIEHPPGCPMIEIHRGVFDYACSVGRAISSLGLDAFGTWNDWPAEIPRPPGRYPIEYWATSCYSHYHGSWEYDEGLQLARPHLVEGIL